MNASRNQVVYEIWERMNGREGKKREGESDREKGHKDRERILFGRETDRKGGTFSSVKTLKA